MVFLVLGEPDDVAGDVHQQGILVHLICIEVEVDGEMPFPEEKDDVSVEADGVLEHFQQGFALFHPFAAHFADDEVVPQGILVDEGTEGEDAADVNGL